MKHLSIASLLMSLTLCTAQGQNHSPAHLPFDPILAWQPKSDLQQSFEADFMVMLATLFPDSPASTNPRRPGYQKAIEKQDFMKRLYLLLLLNPPVFIPAKQPVTAANYDLETQSVSYLMRGRRWNIDITGVPAESIVKTMTGNAAIISYRTAATHGASIKKDGQIVEDKLSGIKGIKAITHGLKRRHLGIDIPLGGYGNPAFNNEYIIDENGSGLESDYFQKKVQHGHVYIYAQTFGMAPVPSYILKYLSPQKSEKNIRSVILVGIEQSAPGKQSMFGIEHNASSGFKDSTLDPSVTNSKKWKHSGISFQPADYGGMVSYVDAYKLNVWKQACEIFLAWPESRQKSFMAKWLRLPAAQLVKARKQIVSEIFHHQDQANLRQHKPYSQVHRGEIDANLQDDIPNNPEIYPQRSYSRHLPSRIGQARVQPPAHSQVSPPSERIIPQRNQWQAAPVPY